MPIGGRYAIITGAFEVIRRCQAFVGGLIQIMFTGIIQRVAEVKKVSRRTDSARLVLDLGELAEEVAVGDSVAVNGACLTAARVATGEAEFDVGAETMKLTSLGELRSGSHANVELALRPDDRLGGHFVQGHVDGTGTVRDLRERPGEWRLKVGISAELAGQMVKKGSVAVDGISLTVAELLPTGFEVSVIPHTLESTTLSEKRAGDTVNIECDMIGKYVRRLLGGGEESGEPLSIERLRREGY